MPETDNNPPPEGPPDQSAVGATVAETTPALPSLEEQLRTAERQAAENRDAWLRAVAEAENVRKRAQQEAENARKFALEGFSTQLLPVRDSLESTLLTDKATIEQIHSGVELTLRLLTQAFDKAGIREIDPPSGERFDPHRHQAMCLVESQGEPNTVVHVMQKGYALNDRVIRPALVTVAKGRDGAS
jgi:molecular chaperone GrpE